MTVSLEISKEEAASVAIALKAFIINMNKYPKEKLAELTLDVDVKNSSIILENLLRELGVDEKVLMEHDCS